MPARLLSRYRNLLSPNVPVLAYLAVLVIAVGWTFLVPGYWVFLGSVACLTAITALGLTVLVGWGGQVSIAQAALTGSSLYITAYLIRQDTFGLPFLVALGVGVVVATVLGALPAVATAKLSGIYVMVLTLGLQITIERTLFADAKLTGGSSVGTQEYNTRPRFLVSFEPERAFYLLVLGTLLAVIVGLTLFRKSRHGRALLLVRTNREAAAAVGISPWWYKVLAFAMAGALAGLAGALTAPLYRAPPTPLDYFTIPSLFLLAIPVAAGFESLFAVVVVSFAFTLMPHATEALHKSPFLLGGIALVAGTYVGPRGLGGAVLDILRRKRVSGARPAPDPSANGEVVVPPFGGGQLAVVSARGTVLDLDDELNDLDEELNKEVRQ
jgi:ABC-type branched-subunit amino acid transport system permease subunit